MRNKFSRICLFLVVFIYLSIASVQANNVEINIYSINDFHGALRARADAPGISILSGAMQELTSSTSNNIIVAAGDLFSTTIDAKDTAGISTVMALNKMGVECISLGNHEFDYAPDIIRQQMRAADFPFMAANIRGGNNTYLNYTIITRNGIKIAFIGIITPETVVSSAKANIAEVEFIDPVLILPKYIKEVRAQGAQIVVLLSHVGSQQGQDGTILGEVTHILDNVQGLDAAITGHTHQLVAGVYNNVPVVQAKCYGQAIGQLKITYSTTDNKILNIEAKAIEVTKDNFQPDVHMGLFVQPYLDAATFKYNKTVAINEQVLTNSKFQESGIADYFSDLIRLNTQSDVVMLNGGGVRKSYIPTGPFTMANLIDIFPFANRMVKMQVTGKTILQALNYGIANPKYGFLRTSGLLIQYNSQLPIGSQIVSATLTNGKKIQDKAYYTLVIPDFLADGGDGYNMFQSPKSKELLGEITDIILAELQKKPRIIYSTDNRVIDIRQ